MSTRFEVLGQFIVRTPLTRQEALDRVAEALEAPDCPASPGERAPYADSVQGLACLGDIKDHGFRISRRYVPFSGRSIDLNPWLIGEIRLDAQGTQISIIVAQERTSFVSNLLFVLVVSLMPFAFGTWLVHSFIPASCLVPALILVIPAIIYFSRVLIKNALVRSAQSYICRLFDAG